MSIAAWQASRRAASDALVRQQPAQLLDAVGHTQDRLVRDLPDDFSREALLDADHEAVGDLVDAEGEVGVALPDLVGDDLLGSPEGIVLVVDEDTAALINGLKVQAELIETGEPSVRLERRPKKLNLLLESLAAQGFGRFAFVSAATNSVADLQIKDI